MSRKKNSKGSPIDYHIHIRSSDFPNLAQANKANDLYQRAEQEWRRGRMRPAFRLMLAAARAGMVPAFEFVAQFYDNGDGVRVNRNAALRWYRRAYRTGDSAAANNIGCIWRDRGNLSRALLWLHRAVSLGDGDANLNIARIYLRNKRMQLKAAKYLKATCASAYATEGSQEEATRLLRKLKAERAARARRGS